MLFCMTSSCSCHALQLELQMGQFTYAPTLELVKGWNPGVKNVYSCSSNGTLRCEKGHPKVHLFLFGAIFTEGST